MNSAKFCDHSRIRNEIPEIKAAKSAQLSGSGDPESNPSEYRLPSFALIEEGEP